MERENVNETVSVTYPTSHKAKYLNEKKESRLYLNA